MVKYQLLTEVTEYKTASDPTNTEETVLVNGSQNVLIDGRNGKVRSRPGFSRTGIANTSLYPIRNGFTWNTSKGSDLNVRFWKDQWEVWLGTVDATNINAWTSYSSGMNTVNIPRAAAIYDSGEAEDLLIHCQGDANLYEWNGAVAVVGSVSATGTAISLVGNSASLTAFGAPTGTAPVTYDYNQLIGTTLRATLKFSSNPTDGQTLLLNINASIQTITFVAAIGATAGNVLIGVDLATTITNLLGLLNAPGSTTATQVAMSGGDQTKIAYITYAATTLVTKAGTSTFDQNRFYATRNKVVVCVRTGTTYTYTSGDFSLSLTGISDITGLVAGDILVQQVITKSTLPVVGRSNDLVFAFQNQLFVASETDGTVYVSKNTDYTNYGYSSPRVAGEGGILTLTHAIVGFGQLSGSAIIFCGPSTAFKAIYTAITVGSTLTESLTALPLKGIGLNQGAYNQETIIPVGNSLIYLTNEPALRELETSTQGDEPQMHALSNPIKPDFDAEDFTNACAIWDKNAVFLSAPANSHVYILSYIENADGKLRRFWQPPQILPIRAFSDINGYLNGHSNSVPETYKLFDGLSDTASDDSKLPINTIAKGAYRSFKDRANLKSMDEYYIEGEISSNTVDCLLTLNLEWQGANVSLPQTINGSDLGILEGVVGASSLAQESLGVDSLAGLLVPPPDAQRFRVIFEYAKEDFHELQWVVSTNDVDRFWSILSQGPNATLSTRKDVAIHR